MKLGFDTIGNATLIAYDQNPILVTDPWINGRAYFGSWGYSHEIPAEQIDAILKSTYVWFSHGHPDHLNPSSLMQFRGKKILLPDHVGGRISADLKSQGFDVTVLEDRRWYPLSEKIKVLCLTDDNQDAVLLIDINGRLVVNLNDVNLSAHLRFIRKTVKSYPISFALAYSGYGDADMNNFYDEDGNVIRPVSDRFGMPLGKMLAGIADGIGAKYFLPFSSMHSYVRKDSIWANVFVAKPKDYLRGYSSTRSQLLPMFLRYDCERDSYSELNPRELPIIPEDPASFGDNWSDLLTGDDFKKVEKYFKSFETLYDSFDFINLRVGNKDNRIEFSKRKFDRGLTFSVPRGSLMTAIEYEVFDDLLIGNFMKTTLHGKMQAAELNERFSKPVAKIGDNGRAHSHEEVRAYMRAYFRRAPLENLFSSCEARSKNLLRKFLPEDSKILVGAKKTYSFLQNL